MSSPPQNVYLEQENDDVFEDDVNEKPEENSVSVELYRARHEQDLDIERVSLNLRIRPEHLIALEEGRFGDLPGPTYVVGFLRSYAEFLGLDSAEIVSRFKAEEEGFDVNQRLRFPTPNQESRIPGVPLLVAALVLAVGSYAGWYHFSATDQLEIELVPPVPARMAVPTGSSTVSQVENDPGTTGAEPFGESNDPAPPTTMSDEPREDDFALAAESNPPSAEDEAPVSTGVPSVMTPPTAPVLAAAATAPAEVTPEPEELTSPLEPPGELAARDEETLVPPPAGKSVIEVMAATPESPVTRPIDPPPSPSASSDETNVRIALENPVPEGANRSPRVYGETSLDTRIRLRAKTESWVQVKNDTDKVLLSRVLHPGDVYLVPNQPGLTLMTGNAGALELIVDGRVAPAIGPPGTVRRDVVLNPERLLAGTATR